MSFDAFGSSTVDGSWATSEDPLLAAAAAAGLPVVRDAAEVSIDLAAATLVPSHLPCVGVGFTEGFLVTIWSHLPAALELDDTERLVGTPVQVVLGSPLVVEQLRRQIAEQTTAVVVPTMEAILDAARVLEASDVHLVVGSPPNVRVGGQLVALAGWAPLSAADLAECCRYVAGDLPFSPEFTGDHDCAMSYGGWRYRASVHRSRGALSVALRTIPMDIPSFTSLGLPDIIQTFSKIKQGLVLVCGPTGSGKSSTLASVVDQINREQAKSIITIEDPVEFIHPSRRSLVRQREVGDDTESFAAGLRGAMRQDPDVILVGEMRDLETIQIALRAAETGHLVLSTLHSQTAETTIDRIIDVFPAGQQNQIRAQLASVLKAVVCQTLLPALDQPGKRYVVCEVLVMNPAVRNHIREGQTHQIPTDLQMSVEETGMQSFDLAMAKGVAAGKLHYDDAVAWANSEKSFQEYLRKYKGPGGGGVFNPNPG